MSTVIESNGVRPAFGKKELQEIDLQVPRTVSFSSSTGEVTMKTTQAADIQLSDGEVLLAATLIKDALHSRNMHFKTDEKSVRSYIIYQHWIFKWILNVCIWGLLALTIFEKPSVEGVDIPYWGTMIIETFFLSYFIFRVAHNAQFDVPKKFWTDPKNLTIIIVIILTFIDMITNIIWINVKPNGVEEAVRWSRPLRPLFLINFPEGRQIRKAVRNIRRTLPDILHVLVLFLCSVALFALMGLKLLQMRNLKNVDGSAYFQDYFESYWDLYVLVTTANNPDVMMPAYDRTRWFALFFMTFTIVNQYIFMSIILATVYNNYKRHLKDEVRSTVYLKRRLLGRAFDILKVMGPKGQYVVPADRWHEVMAVVAPHRSKVQIDLLLYVLDEDGDHNIERKDFLTVSDLLNVKLTEVKDRMTRLEKIMPGCYTSGPSYVLQKVVRHRGFRYFFDFAILVNAICIGLSLEEAEWFFLAIFTLEIILKFYTYGPVKFFRSSWNTFDFFVIAAAVITTMIETISGHYSERGQTLDFILVLRVLRLIRLLGSIERFQIIITTIVNIGPSIMTYGGVIFILYYIYAIIGMEAFNGRIRFFGYANLSKEHMFCGTGKLNGSEFYVKRYCNNNFNNIFHSIVLLFELTVVNQWHVLTQGFVLVTHKATRLFFISFHVFCVVILLNIFTAFVLEVFLLEYTLSGTALEDTIEAKIKDMGLGKGMKPVGRKVTLDQMGLVDEEELMDESDGISMKPQGATTAPNGSPTSNATIIDAPPGIGGENELYFKLKRKTKKKLEELLNAMFEGEIAPDDEGLDDQGQDLKMQGRRLTLDSVS